MNVVKISHSFHTAHELHGRVRLLGHLRPDGNEYVAVILVEHMYSGSGC